jgi:hypothetical protein
MDKCIDPDLNETILFNKSIKEFKHYKYREIDPACCNSCAYTIRTDILKCKLVKEQLNSDKYAQVGIHGICNRYKARKV